MDGDQDTSTATTSLKIVFVLSIILICIDFYDGYNSYGSLVEYSQTLIPEVFEQCVKYHLIAHMFYTVYGALASFSAGVASLALLTNYNSFLSYFFGVFLFYNYYIFGPLLLGFSLFGMINFDKVCYVCDSSNYHYKNINAFTVIGISFAFMLSLMVTVIYAIFTSNVYITNSIKFNSDGSYILGKVFWWVTFNRGREVVGSNNEEREIELREALQENNEQRPDNA